MREFSNESVSVMLVGNKLDLRHFRAVPTEVALKFAEKHHLAFIGEPQLQMFVTFGMCMDRLAKFRQ